jgi:long-chain acyl-CoA synthetase
MALSFHEAAAQLSGPGQPFEMIELAIRGLSTRIFRHAPGTLRDVLDAGRLGGNQTYLVYEHERWTFNDVFAAADAFGAALVDTYGIKRGDRVALAMRNYPEWVIAYIAIVSVGAISVSLNSWWTADELAFALDDCSPRLVVGDHERVERAASACARLGIAMLAARSTAGLPPGTRRWEDVVHLGAAMPQVAIDPDDDATILYTSGTTGHPKGAVSTHRAVVSAVFAYRFRNAVEAIRYPDRPAPPAPAFILIVPLFHVTGEIPVMLGSLLGRAKLVMMYRWDPEKALDIIQRERITHFVGVPTQSWDLVNSPRFADFDTSSLRNVGGGGAPAPPALVDRVATRVPSGGPTIGYGMTETNAYGPQNSGADYLEHPRSTGRVLPIVQIEVRGADHVALAVGELGEIWFRGANLIRGYWNQPAGYAAAISDVSTVRASCISRTGRRT